MINIKKQFIHSLEKTRLKFLRKIKRTKRNMKALGRIEAKEVISLGLAFTHLQIRTRPRARLLSKVIVVLALIFLASNKAVDYVKPHEAEIKINGQALLVAEDKALPIIQNSPEIVQDINALRSPFEYEKPVDGQISQGYRGYHRALDITSPLGTRIRPVGPGIVEFAGFVPDGKGNVVIVDHGDGLKTLYAHMGKIYVGAGNMVNPNMSLGTVGLTGHTTGPHVHFEVYDHGVAVNPLNLLP